MPTGVDPLDFLLQLSGVLVWVLVGGSLARSTAVCRKSFVFSFLPIRKVLVLPFAGGVSPPFPVFFFCFQRVIHRIVAPTTCSLLLVL